MHLDRIEAAIFDVDGTLFDYKEKKIHDSTIDAIHRLKENGVTIIIASGRSYPLLGTECLEYIPADYYVTSNGHAVLDDCGREIYAQRFTFEQTELVVDLTRYYGNGLLLKYGTFSALYSKAAEMFEVFNNIGLSREMFRDCPDMDYHFSELPIGFTIKGSDEIKSELRCRSKDFRVELFHDETECDVFSPKCNKMLALTGLVDTLNLDSKDCIAFGDSRNDIEMIRWAGLGVAMGNSCDDLIEVADVICDNSWEHGIANTVKSLIDEGKYI